MPLANELPGQGPERGALDHDRVGAALDRSAGTAASRAIFAADEPRGLGQPAADLGYQIRLREELCSRPTRHHRRCENDPTAGCQGHQAAHLSSTPSRLRLTSSRLSTSLSGTCGLELDPGQQKLRRPEYRHLLHWVLAYVAAVRGAGEDWVVLWTRHAGNSSDVVAAHVGAPPGGLSGDRPNRSRKHVQLVAVTSSRNGWWPRPAGPGRLVPIRLLPPGALETRCAQVSPAHVTSGGVHSRLARSAAPRSGCERGLAFSATTFAPFSSSDRRKMASVPRGLSP